MPQLGRTGLEPESLKNCNSNELEIPEETRGAESGAFSPDLTRIVDIWPTLDDDTRKGILDMVKAVCGNVQKPEDLS